MSMLYLISGWIFSFGIILPVGIKWDIEKRILISSAGIIGIIVWIAASGITRFWPLRFQMIWAIQTALIVVTVISIVVLRFYRDPERIPPKLDNIILSPADGKIIYIKKMERGTIPCSDKNGRKFSLTDLVQSNNLDPEGYIVGIAMNFLDVHINRCPINGRIEFLKHIYGGFHSLRKKESVFVNERFFTVIENHSFKIGIVQIASRLVRNIVCFITEGSQVTMGQRFGMIRFGSQVDLILPDLPTMRIAISVGDKVKAGLSIIAHCS